jgi:DNA polymerase (family 10)
MTNADVARVFGQIAIMLELDNANSFRVRAYREGARVIDSLPEPLTAIAAREGGLEELRGIGKDLAQKIRDVLATGTTPLHEELRARYPLEMVRLTDLQGLGAKRVRQMHDQLGVRDRVTLEAAARAGKLRDLPGFGEKMEAKILHSLEVSSHFAGRMLLAGAWNTAEALAEVLRALPGVRQVEIAGSFRRRTESVGDLDLLACCGDAEPVMQTFVSHPQVAEVTGRGGTKSSVRLANGLQVDLRVVPEESFGAALLYFTGSKAHNIDLRRIAIEKGLRLNEYGLTRDDTRVAGRTEEEVYQALDLPWIPPELREARGEIDLARAGRLPVLIEASDLRGDLHMHTTRSDGRNTLVEMVRACRERGYAYCAITEHSKALAMIGGFDEARVRQSVDEIAAVRREVPGIEVLHGLEVDILADGQLDLGDDGLEQLDWVTVSLHSRLDQPREVVTERVLRAIEHPATCALSHPTGRMIGSRAGAALDFDRIFERAAARGVAMEINAQPDRLDLSDQNARRAHELGVPIVIDTDAHSVTGLDAIRFGVFNARRAGLTKGDVLNTLPFERFRERARVRRGAKAAPGGAPGKAAKRR